MWVCIQSEPNLWTTGFYRPDGRWEPAGDDHPSHEAALQQVAWLNGTSNVVARDLMNQKADLLAALRALRQPSGHFGSCVGQPGSRVPSGDCTEGCQQARAAIEKAEGS